MHMKAEKKKKKGKKKKKKRIGQIGGVWYMFSNNNIQFFSACI